MQNNPSSDINPLKECPIMTSEENDKFIQLVKILLRDILTCAFFSGRTGNMRKNEAVRKVLDEMSELIHHMGLIGGSID